MTTFSTASRAHLRRATATDGTGYASWREHQVVSTATYYLRNQDVVDVADELLAFQVNASAGTQDTVDRARLQGIPVVVFVFEAATGPPSSRDDG